MAVAPNDLSLAMIVRNEARCLERCLRSCKDVVGEIVLVDTGSTDATLQIAAKFDARVFTFPWADDFSEARNYALDKATSKWILVLDADEELSPGLAAEIPEFIHRERAIGRLKIASQFRRNNQTLCSHAYVSRLFPRGAQFAGRIHEQIISPLPRRNLQHEVWHDGYLQPTKTDRNIRLLQRELELLPDDPYLLFQLALEYNSLGKVKLAGESLERAVTRMPMDVPFAPNAVVDYLYVLSELKSFDRGLALIGQWAGKVDDFPDFHLACGLFFMNLVRSDTARYVSYLPRIESSFRRALSIGESQKYKSVKGAGTFLAQYNLGTLYHVFGNAAAAKECFEKAAADGYTPAQEMLRKLSVR